MVRLFPLLSPDAEEMQIELLRRATPAQRFEIACGLTELRRMLIFQVLRRANPTLSKTEIDLWFVEHSYGPELAEAVRQQLIEREQAQLLDQ